MMLCEAWAISVIKKNTSYDLKTVQFTHIFIKVLFKLFSVLNMCEVLNI